jgi:hypothetical protein
LGRSATSASRTSFPQFSSRWLPGLLSDIDSTGAGSCTCGPTAMHQTGQDRTGRSSSAHIPHVYTAQHVQCEMQPVAHLTPVGLCTQTRVHSILLSQPLQHELCAT